ncbi:MAG TPA: ABC transporter permease [Opitutaceae bacterium]|nr:ABC transporter permease [Opitutaceae bacterium]
MNWRNKIRALFGKKKLDAEMDEEMRAHLARRTEANIAAGMSPGEARYAAQRQFGGVDQLKEIAREQRVGSGLEALLRDFRHAVRHLGKSRGFAAIATLTLALGIGLNTSMFSLMNLLLFQPLPFPDRDHLVRVFRTTPQSQKVDHLPADYLELERESEPFADLAGYRLWGFTLAQGDRPPVHLNALRVSASFFPVLGLQPELGRFFAADEDRPGNRVIILSHAMWQAQFGGDRGVINRTVRIDGEPTTIIGVMPAAFASIFLWGPGDAFRPLALTDLEIADRNEASVRVLGRFRSDLSLEQINLRFAALGAQLARNRPREQSQDGLNAVTLQATTTDSVSRGLSFMLLGLAGFVLLIACANLANLQLARAIVRRHEFAIRAALGASRVSLLRPLLCESIALSLAGGALGVLIAIWANAWMSSRLSANGVAIFTLHLDWKVLSFALVISVVTGLIFGLVPAWLMSRIRVGAGLKISGRGNTGDRTQHRLRHSLIVAQFALALVLLAGAGVFIRGFNRILARETGWDQRSVLQGVLNLSPSRYATPAQSYAFYTQLQERLSALPGVENVAVGWTLPLFQFLTNRVYVVEGRELPPAGREPVASVNGVSPSFLPTLKTKLVAGRNFSETDTVSAPPVVIINETMARTLFPGENPIGRRLGGADASNRAWAEIVGVMPDLRFAVAVLAPPAHFQVLRPLAQETWNYVTVAVRASNAAALAGPVRRIIAEMDPDLAVQQLNTVEKLAELNSAGTFRMINTLLVAFALLGLFLAALGLYGVIDHLVVQRTPEIGVRVALGALPGQVVWLVLRTGLLLTAVGTVFGLAGSFGLVQLVAGFLPDLAAHDPAAIGGVTLLLLATALLACWLPARRAAGTSPLIALRAE